jgi:hypothetical protein
MDMISLGTFCDWDVAVGSLIGVWLRLGCMLHCTLPRIERYITVTRMNLP